MIVRKCTILVAGSLGLVLWAAGVMANSAQTAVAGTLSPVENECLLVSAFFYGMDCSYDHHTSGTGGPALPWVGPTQGPVYFGVDDPHGIPTYTPGDSETPFAPPVTGALSVDDRDTPAGEDDLISGTLIVGAALRSHISRVDEKSPARRAVESWRQITHTMAPTGVQSATRNAVGGYDYVIAANGMPARLCRRQAATDCYPSAAAPLITDGKWALDTWQGPGTQPLGRGPAFGANAGAQTTAVIESYSCADTGEGTLCRQGINLWSGREDPGWDNLLLTVSTDGSGHVLRAEGYWLDEFRIEAGPAKLRGPPGADNSWVGGYLSLTGPGQRGEK